MNAPTHLRVEHLDAPFGITERRPRLSWRLPPGYGHQSAYQLLIGGWDSGEVASSQQLLVPYDGPELCSGEVVPWRVRVWAGARVSDWSEESSWEMGLLTPADWAARWVAPRECEAVLPPFQRPAHYLRRDLILARVPERARLYVTAHGIYECYVNGRRVGDLELTPGFTSYNNRLQVQAYDVTDLLVAGDNTLGLVLSDGWYRGQTGFTRLINGYGNRLAALAQLDGYLDGRRTTLLATDGVWRSGSGAIVGADLMEGQMVDLRREREGWSQPGFDQSDWTEVDEVRLDFAQLCGSPAPPVRAIERLKPVSVTRAREDCWVVDLGQNINGWVELRRLGDAGTRVTLTHGEALDAAGDVTVENIRGVDYQTRETLSAGQVDVVTSAGRPGDVFEPRHTTHGFQYVRIEGPLDKFGVHDVEGVVVHTDLRRTGWFRCSDERINKLHEVVVWSFRGNACDVPTDCPQRERAGWTGDWQIFFPTAAFLYDVAGFTTKWLRDLAADQWPDGRVTNYVPDPWGAAGREHPLTAHMTGSAGWGDAAAIVPWLMYQTYDDKRVLEEQYESLTNWLRFAKNRAANGRHATRVARNAEPHPHEPYVWDSGFHWGEWLEPGGMDAGVWTLESDLADVATAYLHVTARIAGETAAKLGRSAEADEHRWFADQVRAAWQTEFCRTAGFLQPDKQATYVRALAFDLVPEDQRPMVVARLVSHIKAAGIHVGTGFLATPHLLPVLADNGEVGLAYELLLQDTSPSWMAMIEKGASTIWESWDGIDDDGVAHDSLNHYSKGAVVSFLHTHTCGLRLLEPGFRRFAIAPMPGGGLSWAELSYDSPYGRIESGWRIEHDRFVLNVTVPDGTTAEAKLPDGSRYELLPGTTELTCHI